MFAEANPSIKSLRPRILIAASLTQLGTQLPQMSTIVTWTRPTAAISLRYKKKMIFSTRISLNLNIQKSIVVILTAHFSY
jgi:hypothetical protein